MGYWMLVLLRLLPVDCSWWSWADIIALLIVGVLLVGFFLYWQWFLERVQNQLQRQRGGVGEVEEEKTTRWGKRLPPPIMKLSLWGRAKGRFAVMMVVAFATWSSFIGWTFWIQASHPMRCLWLCSTKLRLSYSCITKITWVSGHSKPLPEHHQPSSLELHALSSWGSWLAI